MTVRKVYKKVQLYKNKINQDTCRCGQLNSNDNERYSIKIPLDTAFKMIAEDTFFTNKTKTQLLNKL